MAAVGAVVPMASVPAGWVGAPARFTRLPARSFDTVQFEAGDRKVGSTLARPDRVIELQGVGAEPLTYLAVPLLFSAKLGEPLTLTASLKLSDRRTVPPAPTCRVPVIGGR